MFRKFPKFCLLGSLGGGVFLGANLHENVRAYLNMKGHVLRGFPTVYASTVIPYQNPTPAVSTDMKNRNNNLNEIMKHGFPSFENIRTFDDFALSYDRRNRNPNWVLEHLTKEKVTNVPGIDRAKSEFITDEKIHPYFRATNADFKRSGYDRGHLAAAGNHRWSQTAMNETFHLSNISPQVCILLTSVISDNIVTNLTFLYHAVEIILE